MWVEAAQLAALSDAERSLYLDFGIRRGSLIGCPASFNLLSVGWYVNEPAPSDAPNLRASEDYEMIATRDIAVGEELTVRYASFSEPTP